MDLPCPLLGLTGKLVAGPGQGAPLAVGDLGPALSACFLSGADTVWPELVWMFPCAESLMQREPQTRIDFKIQASGPGQTPFSLTQNWTLGANHQTGTPPRSSWFWRLPADSFCPWPHSFPRCLPAFRPISGVPALCSSIRSMMTPNARCSPPFL